MKQRALIAAVAMGITGTCHAASSTVYRCDKAGKATYTDEPCEGAKEVDVTPTEGLNKWSGEERVSAELRQKQANRQVEDGMRKGAAQGANITTRKHEDVPNQDGRSASQLPAPKQAGRAPQGPFSAPNIGTVVTGLMLLLAASAVIRVLTRKRKTWMPPVAKQPLTFREQAMYNRLKATFPEHNVLAQVAFSALLNAKALGVRNTFDRKVADFVLTTKAFEVIAVIELDDASHIGKLSQDMARDAMLEAAGYRTLRFRNVPDADALLERVNSLSAGRMTAQT